ncbi:MAG: glycoside hydrolase [Verrucomicrobia bacterium]|nr:MAG: glycoside hydrolase [Verrucomicrobiota bacterium]
MQPRQLQSSVTPRPAPSTPTSQRPASTGASVSQTPQTEPSKSRSAEKPIEFTLKMPQAKSALIAGSFNNWDPKRTPMRKDNNGGWKATVPLPPGRYEYRFVADGQWITDPNSKERVQNPFGSTNSVVVVTS